MNAHGGAAVRAVHLLDRQAQEGREEKAVGRADGDRRNEKERLGRRHGSRNNACVEQGESRVQDEAGPRVAENQADNKVARCVGRESGCQEEADHDLSGYNLLGQEREEPLQNRPRAELADRIPER
jgi:hypothetical protein